MHHKRSSTMRPLFVTILLWLCSVALLFIIKNVIELYTGPVAETWIDLTLVLVAYLMFFLLAPLQRWLQRRSRKRARRHVDGHAPDVDSPLSR
ncbi:MULTISPECIES: hypothetical protein [unclassified Pseudomonas]|jgi:uncharacterized membrane protein|uniref:hypothetical protein n=1 Tax=unclassified Pseudomonas TaxID=196821 RepID=UPI000F56A384|nr:MULTISPECIES: hypothetical protein [unclassified Pseudomonas]AZF26636.1 hypothetical protein C4J90_2463 [Pseudomonas sp. R2-60-08W]AZF37261.1 hypothetical protein C4J88_2478 [Pseudomonas sp. R4-39-08]AZF42420.1 hypothetical protein C4J87_2261 [Pseudomonas sp. R1-43-08]AZF15955.1 hypothetical protein C4J92_2471 [Pseudomonas sp. R3-18-08]AZF21303.1 hypothetical protein C4J91_2553 [Pseudomonas sp. R3-52-08]